MMPYWSQGQLILTIDLYSLFEGVGLIKVPAYRIMKSA